MMKRQMDLTLSLISIVVLSPVLVSVAFLLLVTQGRPILFTQPRVGFKGKIFNLYKFRTMRPLREGENPHGMERLTIVGKIVRSLSLDELPSLINIIKGEMSLVGPRPLLIQYLDRYSKEEMHRHDVLPGLTGWAQVNGRNTLSWSDKFKYDVWYAKNQSVLLDIKIIFLTLKVIIVRKDINYSASDVMEEFNPGLYVFGAGGHAKVALSVLEANDLKVMGIFDDNPQKHGKFINGVKVLGSFEDSCKYRIKKAVIGIGCNATREKVTKEYNYNWISIIHPSAIIHPTVRIGKGVVVYPGAIVNIDSQIGDYVILNTGSIVEHDCLVGNYAHICPTSVLTGGVRVGEGSMIGAGTKITPGKSVGDWVTTGAGSVVVEDIMDSCVAVGVPAKIIKNNISQIQRKKA